MAEFTIKGAYDTLFYGDDFVATAKLTATRNQLNNTFTVAVTGMKAWSKYALNKALSVTCWLATDSNGSGKVPGSCTIPASGSNSYAGDLPKGGGYTSISGCSKTFNGNISTGACPTVYLYFSVSTGNVKWLSQSTETNTVYASATSKYSGNISSTVQSNAGGANDRVAPVIIESATKVYPQSSSKIGYQVKVDTGASGGDYSVIIRNTTANKETSNSGTDESTILGQLDAQASDNQIVITATKKRNNLTTKWEGSANCSLPNCDLSVKPTGLNTAEASIKCTNFKTYARVNSEGYGTIQTDANTNRIINITRLSNTVHTITANTKRVDCTIESPQASTSLDMRLPSVSNVTVTPLSSTTAKVTFQSNFSGTAEWTDSNSTFSETFTIAAANTLYTWYVSLNDNTSDTYRLRVLRSGTHSVLYTDVLKTVSSGLNTATLIGVTTAGNALTAKVSVEGELRNHNISARLKNSGQNYATVFVSGVWDTDGYVFDFTELPINVPLTLEVRMQNNSSGLYNTQDINSDDLKCLGVLYLYDGKEWRLGVTHVYDGTKFIAGAPYIAIKKSQNVIEWTYGKVVDNEAGEVG